VPGRETLPPHTPPPLGAYVLLDPGAFDVRPPPHCFFDKSNTVANIYTTFKIGQILGGYRGNSLFVCYLVIYVAPWVEITDFRDLGRLTN